MDNIEKTAYLSKENLTKLLFKFSMPCILSLLIGALYNIVDQIFIGNSELGYLGNAATGIVFPITFITLAFAWCVGDGAAAYLSLCQGKNENSDVHKCIGTGLIVTLAVSAILMVFSFLFKTEILVMFGATDATLGLASDYFGILIAAFPLFMLSNMLNSVIRADGSPAFSMISLLCGAILNIILDPVFIFILKWGIKGAAYATVIGQAASFLLCAVYLFKTKTFKLSVKSFIPDFRAFAKVLKLGLSTFITQISVVAVSLICNIMLRKYGETSVYGPDIPISVISIVTKIYAIVLNIVIGFILGVQPILGYNYGAKNYKRVRELCKITLVLTATVGIIATLIFELFPNAVMSIFGSSDNALYNEFATYAIRVFLSLITFSCFIKVFSIFFQALGMSVKAMAISLIRDIIVFIPLVIILPKFMGVKGILIAAPISDIAGMAVTVFAFLLFYKTVSLKTEKKNSLALQNPNK